jgi:hypothetical protein
LASSTRKPPLVGAASISSTGTNCLAPAIGRRTRSRCR